ncbi:MAG TPA: glycosyltransferase [Candidatus Brocadiia bacterium]|nr:glycosyltransferase [Candidatus Brocadiia bacterium]
MTKPIRVLHVIATLDPHGAERQMAALCAGLDRRTFEPSVCCLTRGGPLEAELAAAGVPVEALGKRGRFDASVLWRLARRIRRLRPAIVHTWLFTANFWGRLAGALAGAPALVASERAVDLWKTWAHRWVDRRLAALSAVVLANSEGVRRFCVERIGLAPDKVRVIRNGLDLARFDAALAAGPLAPLPEAEGPVVLCVGRLEEQKGHVYLLRALAGLARAGRRPRLWLAGGGPLRASLEAMARELGVAAQVDFLGGRDDVPALLNRADALALPSLWEGLPNAVIEAMAASRPVAATAIPGTDELVTPETGLLVPPRDPESLAAALARLLDDAALRARLGAAGRRRVERDFTLARMIAETEALYQSLAG